MNSRLLFVTACLYVANAVKLEQEDGAIMPPAMPDMPAMPEMGGEDLGVDDAVIDEVGAYATGENSRYTAGDGTTFVNNFEEEDDASEVKFDQGKLAVQTYGWDPSLGAARPEESGSESESRSE